MPTRKRSRPPSLLDGDSEESHTSPAAERSNVLVENGPFSVSVVWSNTSQG